MIAAGKGSQGCRFIRGKIFVVQCSTMHEHHEYSPLEITSYIRYTDVLLHTGWPQAAGSGG